MDDLGLLLPFLAIFWVYELFEAVSHVAYAYRLQDKPTRVDDAFRFGTLKETLLNTTHLVVFLLLWSAGYLGAFELALLAISASMHFVFTASWLLKGRAMDALVHGYDHGLIPFRSPPLAGPRLDAYGTKVLSHLDIFIHSWLAIRLGLMLPLAITLPVLVGLVVLRRKVIVEGLPIFKGWNVLVYAGHAAALLFYVAAR